MFLNYNSNVKQLNNNYFIEPIYLTKIYTAIYSATKELKIIIATDTNRFQFPAEIYSFANALFENMNDRRCSCPNYVYL